MSSKKEDVVQEDEVHVFNGIHHPKKLAFLVAFANCGSRTEAAEAAGCDRSSHWHWLRKDEAYAAAFEDAELMAGHSLEDEARKRAFKGSDTLLIFLLKGAMQEKYGDALRLPSRIEKLKEGDLDAIIQSGRVLAASDPVSEGRESSKDS